MSTNVRLFLSHNTFKGFKTDFSSVFALYIPRKRDVVYCNVITNDVVCAPFVTTLYKIIARPDRRLCYKYN